MDRTNNYIRKFYQLIIGLYAIGTGAPALANDGVTNVAGPSASATGNVTNQAVQVLQGPWSTNNYGSGVACQSPTISLTPFVMGNSQYGWDPGTYPSQGVNLGISAGFQIPLDAEPLELCKERARTEIARQQAETDKARLDFELVRLIKCGEAARMGVRFHPNSPYAGICADVVVVNPNPPAPPVVPPQQTNETTQQKILLQLPSHKGQ